MITLDDAIQMMDSCSCVMGRNTETAWNIVKKQIMDLTAERDNLQTALKRAMQHSIPSQWYCASCAIALKQWIDSGFKGNEPELCCLCKSPAKGEAK